MTGPLLRRSKRPAFTGALFDWVAVMSTISSIAWLTVFSFSGRRIRWPPERGRARASDRARAADGGRASRARDRLAAPAPEARWCVSPDLHNRPGSATLRLLAGGNRGAPYAREHSISGWAQRNLVDAHRPEGLQTQLEPGSTLVSWSAALVSRRKKAFKT